MDASGTSDARSLGVDGSCVTALSLRACKGTISSTVVAQELLLKVAARNCDGCTLSDAAINQAGAVFTPSAELRQAGADAIIEAGHVGQES
jgi:hypothetical protein